VRNPTKGNAACWDCKFYLVLNNSPVCCKTQKNVLILIKPMECPAKEKASE